MRIPRIYHPQRLDLAEITLTAEASAHVTRVLRLREDAAVIIFDGQGNAVSATLLPQQGKLCRVRVIQAIKENTESPLMTHLGIAMIKGDRMSYALQKAVELGVTAITPLATEHSVIQLDADRKSSKHEHWHGILHSACEQCHRSRIPTLNPALAFEHWVTQQDSETRIYFDVKAEKTFTALPSTRSVSLIIGPEGGLSDNECHFADKNGFVGVRLGPRILRAETAVVAALTAVQLSWGDFGE